MTKIGIYAHIIPPKYAAAVKDITSTSQLSRNYRGWIPTLKGCERRYPIMDRYDEYVQVLTVSGTHTAMCQDKAVELAKTANNEVAELIYKYPERCVGGVATLPTNVMDAGFKEADRAINKLNLKGVLLWTSVLNKPTLRPEFIPLYENILNMIYLSGSIPSGALQSRIAVVKESRSTTFIVSLAGSMRLLLI